MTTMFVCDDVEYFSISNELSYLCIPQIIMNRFVERTSFTVTIRVSMNSQVYIIMIFVENRMILQLRYGSERIEIMKIIVSTICIDICIFTDSTAFQR